MKAILLAAAAIILVISIVGNHEKIQLEELLMSPLVYAAGFHMFYAYVTGTKMYSGGFISENPEDNPASRAALGFIGIFISGFVIYLLWSSNAQHT